MLGKGEIYIPGKSLHFVFFYLMFKKGLGTLICQVVHLFGPFVPMLMRLRKTEHAI